MSPAARRSPRSRGPGGPAVAPGGSGPAWIAGLALAAALSWPVGAAPQAPGSGLRCQLCHGEAELLRQQVDAPERADRLLVAPGTLGGSAHAGMACGECHRGYDAFPHPEEGGSTASCGSCHSAEDSAWSAGAHAPGAGDGGAGSARDPGSTAGCSSCHGVHDVAPAERLAAPAGVRAMNGRCLSCHATSALPPGAPHADSVACHACHRPHRVRHVDTPEAAVAPARQASTCGACHEEVTAVWTEDAHGSAVAGAGGPPASGAEAETTGEEEARRPPACTNCHGQHGMTRLASEVDPGREVSRCRDCHEDYADTFGDSYHGQAVSLGSPASASCADCHTGHAIHPASDPRSSVAEANLVETCGDCHPRANASFVQFEPHADPHDREKNPILYWTYNFMTFLLFAVLGVFGLHTLLWIVRIGVGALRGEDVHGPPRRQGGEGA